MGTTSKKRKNNSPGAMNAGADCPFGGQCPNSTGPGGCRRPYLICQGPVSVRDIEKIAAQIMAGRGGGQGAVEERICNICGKPYVAILDPEVADVLANSFCHDEHARWFN